MIADPHREEQDDESRKAEELWLSLCLCDSAFPAGGLALSSGLESAMQHLFVRVKNTNSLRKFLNLTLEQTAYQLLPLMVAALHCTECVLRDTSCTNGKEMKNEIADDKLSNWLTEMHAIDERCNVITTNEVTHRASVHQGKCMLRVISDVFEHTSSMINAVLHPTHLSRMNKEASNPYKFQSHYAPAFGMICGLLKLPLPLARKLYFRCVLRDLISAASRLNIIGPLEGVQVQVEYSRKIEKLLRQFEERDSERTSVCNGTSEETVDLHETKRLKTCHGTDCHGTVSLGENARKNMPTTSSTAPILELLQGRHDLLYSRLFNS
jgi:urease accessory protein